MAEEIPHQVISCLSSDTDEALSEYPEYPDINTIFRSPPDYVYDLHPNVSFKVSDIDLFIEEFETSFSPKIEESENKNVKYSSDILFTTCKRYKIYYQKLFHIYCMRFFLVPDSKMVHVEFITNGKSEEMHRFIRDFAIESKFVTVKPNRGIKLCQSLIEKKLEDPRNNTKAFYTFLNTLEQGVKSGYTDVLMTTAELLCSSLINNVYNSNFQIEFGKDPEKRNRIRMLYYSFLARMLKLDLNRISPYNEQILYYFFGITIFFVTHRFVKFEDLSTFDIFISKLNVLS